MKINAIIVDDESLARELLKEMITSYCTEVEILAECKNVKEAVAAIHQFKPELIFLDIEMPGFSGFEIFDFFTELHAEVVFTTAYDQYAVKAFEVSAIDYLLKPLQVSELRRAIAKVRDKLMQNTLQQRLHALKENLIQKEINKIAIPDTEGLTFIDLDHVLYLLADGNYTKICLMNGEQIIASKNMKKIESVFGEHPQFFRVHRSAIVNLKCIKRFLRNESSLIMDDGKSLPVSKEKRRDFEKVFTAKKL